MFKVIYEDQEANFSSLGLAIEHAKTLPHFVTIIGGEDIIVGRFGVDAVVAGVLPNGIDYTWRKRRI